MARYSTSGKLRDVNVRGAALSANVVEAVTSASLSLSCTQVSQLDLTLSDPQDWLLASGLFEPATATRAGSAITYAELAFECAAVESTGDNGGTLVVTARSAGAQRMRRAVGALTRSNLSPTEFLALEAKAAGLAFVGQPSAKQATIVRQVQAADGTGTDESSWDVGQRLAQEVGFLCFESAGVLYFAEPTWLIARQGATKLSTSWRGRDTGDGLLLKPACRTSSDDATAAATITTTLAAELGDEVRPGWRHELYGRARFDGAYLVTDVAIPLNDAAPVEVTSATPIDPEPQPPSSDTESAGAGYSAGASSGSGTSGSATASEFVRVALTQAGKRYIFGSEASGSDADPKAFDCSELVEWALSRCGVSFVDGSQAQRGRVRKVPLAQAIATRGALLFTGSHVAISLGDGRTIEAANSKLGVLSLKAAGRFVDGGLVPGLDYGQAATTTVKKLGHLAGQTAV